ncbi:MAG TPA: zf-HC2 domain-containing protein [Burkholderiales bacterium]|nr:zf-HC2 domain-containing protein [Burkholderiales bacterium]
MIPSCRETSELLSQALDRPLTVREKLLVRVHLPLCNGCRNFREQLAFMRRAAKDWARRSP